MIISSPGTLVTPTRVEGSFSFLVARQCSSWWRSAVKEGEGRGRRKEGEGRGRRKEKIVKVGVREWGVWKEEVRVVML